MQVIVWSDKKASKEEFAQHKAVLHITLNKYFNSFSECFKPDI